MSVKVLLAHHADLKLKSDVWTDVMAVPPHGYLPYNKTIPHGGETALMFAARVGDLDSAKLLVAAGANVNDADAWGVSATTLAAHSGFTRSSAFLARQRRRSEPAAPNGFTALHEAIMRRDEKMVAALLDHRRGSQCSAEDLDADPPLFGRLAFRAVTGGRDAVLAGRALHRTRHHAAAGQARRRSAVRAPCRLCRRAGLWRSAAQRERERADGGGRNAPREVHGSKSSSEREALTLETVKLAVELGADLNLANTDGRTALDAAKALRMQSVVDFLTAKGAKPGVPGAKPNDSRSRDAGRAGRGAVPTPVPPVPEPNR